MSEDERAIREVIATWMRASAAGDGETVLDLMADDVVFFVPGRAFGKREFAAAQQGLAGARLEATSKVREVRVSGDWAFASTDLSIVMTPAGGEPGRRAGAAEREHPERLPAPPRRPLGARPRRQPARGPAVAGAGAETRARGNAAALPPRLRASACVENLLVISQQILTDLPLRSLFPCNS